MSLIPFPTQELFEDQLGSFDLIIFQNFTYRGYQMRRYLPDQTLREQGWWLCHDRRGH